MSSRQILLQRLAPELSPAIAQTLMTDLRQATGKPDTEARVLTLLDELQQLSPKAAGSAVTPGRELGTQRPPHPGRADETEKGDTGIAYHPL